ncbi:RidA family protein [Streptomyces sp. SDT5-1]|uniref:RidA family protein n=1 Tax=Streptomyces sp. SDT5-1 TaxID=3406418 RepID=UPI003FD30EB9
MSVKFTPNIPELGKLYGAYSPASSGSGTMHSIAGQLGGLPDGSLPGDGSVYAQTKQSFSNVKTVLDGIGLTFADVLRFNTFIVNRDSIPEFMEARREVFAEIYPNGEYPPNTLVLVSGLVEAQFSVEIEALAIG